jgi:hypothetical protein
MDVLDQIAQVLIDKGGLLGISTIVEGLVIIKLFTKYVEARDKCEVQQDEFQKEKDALNADRLADIRALIPVVDANNRGLSVNTAAVENRTRALDAHTEGLERVALRLENLEQQITKQRP